MVLTDGKNEPVLPQHCPLPKRFFSPSFCCTDSSLVTPVRRRAYKAQEPSKARLLERRRESRPMLKVYLLSLPLTREVPSLRGGGRDLICLFAQRFFARTALSFCCADSSLVTPVRRRAYKAQPSKARLLARRRGSRPMLKVYLLSLPLTREVPSLRGGGRE